MNRLTFGLIGAVWGAIAGCDVPFPATPDDAGSGSSATFSVRSLPEVALDRSVAGVERRFMTGLVPVALSTNTFDQGARLTDRVTTAAGMTDCFVARPRANWEEFGPEGDNIINADLVAAVDLMRDAGVDCVVLEIDAVSDRRNVGRLPEELEGMNFADDPVRDPLKEMAVQLAVQLQPTYLSIGVEMNGYFEAHPEDFENYVSLHKETYDAVKAAAPNVQFVASFNLESLQGFFGDLDEFSNHGEQWFLIDMFEPKLDAVTFSSLPFPLFIRPVLIPDDYFSRIELHTSRDILFTELGWPGNPDSPIHTPIAQAEYLAHTVRLMQGMNQVKLAVWSSLFDPDLGSPDDLHEDFQTLGMIDVFGNEKPALAVWLDLQALPYRP